VTRPLPSGIVPPLPEPTILRTYWLTGVFRCVLCSDRIGLSVQILTDTDALFTEPCSDADDGARRAEALFAIFDEAHTST
jgi:hypothetical protein